MLTATSHSPSLLSSASHLSQICEQRETINSDNYVADLGLARDSTVGADDPTSTDRMSLMAVEADRGRGWIADRLLIDFGFYEPCQVSQRLLPAEITGLRWNGIRQALLHHIELGADRYFFQRHSHLNVARQAGIVEFVRVAQAFVRNELDIFASERMAFARRDILNVPPTFGSR